MNPEEWAQAHAGYFDRLEPAQVVAVIAAWREAGAQASERADVEHAAALQRHYTRRGTGLPANFALVLTAEEAIAFKFDPRNGGHPLSIVSQQFKKRVASWPRGALRIGETETGPLAYGMSLHVDGRDPIPCRAPKLPRNPAAAYAVSLLGGELPS